MINDDDGKEMSAMTKAELQSEIMRLQGKVEVAEMTNKNLDEIIRNYREMYHKETARADKFEKLAGEQLKMMQDLQKKVFKSKFEG